ncbi:MAG TPA: hypothetical protein VMS73_03055 [Anaerolineaceae bacterium]|nr:hypothetical protein [Anaerolineaceae bacterium]
MVEKSERRWVWIFALVILTISTIPYLAGYWVQGSDWRFLGFIFGVEDGNSYIAKMLSGAAGDWLFRTPYTAYPQNGAFAFFPYILLGKLTSQPAQHEQLVFLFQAFRWAGGFLLAIATYDFASFFVKKVQYRRWATAIILLGGGLGWLSALGLSALWQGRIPLEFYSPETFGFLSLAGLPHLEFARALLLWGLRDYLANGAAYSFQRACKGGLLWLALGMFQPLTVLISWILIVAHAVVVTALKGIAKYRASGKFGIAGSNDFKTAGLMILISAPIVVYTYAAFNSDPFLRNWTSQNLILSPPFGDYLLALIPVLPLALYGVFTVFKQRDWQGILLGVWVCLFPILAYAPYNLQRRLPEGIWAALVVLAMIAIERHFFGFQKYVKIWGAASFLPAFLFFIGALFTVLQPATPLYAPKNEIDAFSALNEIAVKNDVVLATFRIANDLPAWAPLRTLYGHGPESINASQLKPEIGQFFSAKGSDSDRLRLINEFNIKYVILGPDEHQAGSWQPGTSNFVELVFQEQAYEIYRIRK